MLLVTVSGRGFAVAGRAKKEKTVGINIGCMMVKGLDERKDAGINIACTLAKRAMKEKGAGFYCREYSR